jgi:hypothetical protein
MLWSSRIREKRGGVGNVRFGNRIGVIIVGVAGLVR